LAAGTAIAAREPIPLSVLEDGIVIDERIGHGLPPDIAYCLDSEVEMGGLGGDDRAYVDLFDRDTVAWFDALSNADGARFPVVVKRRHAEWRLTARAEDAMALDWAGLGGLRWLLDECAYGIASEMRHAGTDTLSPAAIAAHLPASADAARIASCAGPIVTRSVEDAGRWGTDAFLAASGRLEGIYRARRGALDERDAAIRAFASARRAGSAPPPLDNARIRKERRRSTSLGRRVLARSFSFLEGLAGRERARAWLSGDAVTVEGRRFDFRLRVRDLALRDHGALEVSVTDKDGVELAALCVYTPATPALDQVSALLLHVVAGEEDEILRKANVIRSTADAHRNAAFCEVRSIRHDPHAIERAGIPIPGVGDLMARDATAAEGRRAVRIELARWLAQGVMAPLVGILGTPEAVSALLPTGRGDLEAIAA
jgi:hypothetical protein